MPPCRRITVFTRLSQSRERETHVPFSLPWEPPMMEIATMAESGVPLHLLAQDLQDAPDGDGTVSDALLDPRDGATLAALRKRTPGGGYEVRDADLVRSIRAWDARGDLD